jgi:protein tyrosine phosphatase
MFNLLPLPYFFLLSVIYFLGPTVVYSALLQGCSLDQELCDENESCIPDGLFGQCYSDSASVSPLLIGEPLNEIQQEVLRAELERLAANGLDWPDATAQCVLAYFKLSVAYDLAYDPNFCNVRNPTNVWALIQRVQTTLGEQPLVQVENIPNQELLENSIVEEPLLDEIPIVVVENDDLPESELIALPEPIKDEKAGNQTSKNDIKRASNATQSTDEKVAEDSVSEDEMNKIISEIAELQDQQAVPELVVEESLEAPLSSDEQNQLNQYVTAVLNDQDPTIKELQPQQMRKLFTFVEAIQNALDEEQQLKQGSAPEVEEIVPLTSVANQQQLLLKKDTEKFNNADMGLANTVHKIVKGDIQRVEGNRVYLKVNQNEIREDELYKLIAYLDKKIAEPNNLYFDEFQYDDGQLSFRVSRFDSPKMGLHKNEKRVDSASGVAQAVYKRRKDIQTLSGVEVDETGIGSGFDVVPVEKNERDWLFFPILFICAFTITTLISVLAVHLVKNRRRTYRENLPEVIDTIEGGSGKATFAYEELCRQRNRMSIHDAAVGVPSKTSSTSSWPDENLLQSELDISTGHIILGFLTEHLERPEKIEEQWNSVANYVNTRGETTIATSAENVSKNRDKTVLPYDENVVTLQPANGDLTQGLQYINASKIHDSDLRHVAYIATQAPLQDTIAEFWQMVWEQGIALIVNLCTQDDFKNNKCDRYWPEEGAKSYGSYEIHLVSEHIWSEDYMVRSFYLKNLHTNETRTVTQFHYISWPESGVPASNKSLLEFRRKVNRSYRGKASPVLVHCSNGSDRTGTYILTDMVVNRIAKGIKELNIAGTVEFLRDQRMKCCQNIEQFKLVYGCVADEVTSLLKNLQH